MVISCVEFLKRNQPMGMDISCSGEMLLICKYEARGISTCNILTERDIMWKERLH